MAAELNHLTVDFEAEARMWGMFNRGANMAFSGALIIALMRAALYWKRRFQQERQVAEETRIRLKVIDRDLDKLERTVREHLGRMSAAGEQLVAFSALDSQVVDTQARYDFAVLWHRGIGPVKIGRLVGALLRAVRYWQRVARINGWRK